MSSGISPEDMVCEATAPRIESERGPSRSAASDVRSDRMMLELTRFIQRVAQHGVSSPIDEAMLEGAKRVFESMIRICEEASEKSSAAPVIPVEHAMAPMSSMSIASFDPESLLESAGPGGVEKSSKKKATKKKATKKKTSKKKTARTRKKES